MLKSYDATQLAKPETYQSDTELASLARAVASSHFQSHAADPGQSGGCRYFAGNNPDRLSAGAEIRRGNSC